MTIFILLLKLQTITECSLKKKKPGQNLARDCQSKVLPPSFYILKVWSCLQILGRHPSHCQLALSTAWVCLNSAQTIPNLWIVHKHCAWVHVHKPALRWDQSFKPLPWSPRTPKFDLMSDIFPFLVIEFRRLECILIHPNYVSTVIFVTFLVDCVVGHQRGAWASFVRPGLN